MAGELNYETIDRPYNSNMSRSESGVQGTPDDAAASKGVELPGSSESSGIDYGSGGTAEGSPGGAYSPEVSSPGIGGPPPEKSFLTGTELTDVWLTSWMKSVNYKPRKTGFYFDGLKGYIEAMQVMVSGLGIKIIQTETGFNSSNAIYIENQADYAAVDIRKGGIGEAIHIEVEDGASYGVSVIQHSDTPAFRGVTDNATNAFSVPYEAQAVDSVNTDFFKEIHYLGGPVVSPVVSVKHWIADNADPNGVVTGEQGDTMQSSNGNFYVNTDGATEWKRLIGVSDLAGIDKVLWSTMFESTTRFVFSGDGTDSNTFTTAGNVQITTANANGWSKTVASVGSSSFLFSGNPVFTAGLYLNTMNSNNQQVFIGVGNIASASGAAGITFTNSHFGFKLLRESGTVNLYATQANGSTESASLLVALGAAGGDFVDLKAVLTSDVGATYYWRENGGAQGSAIISTNPPSAATSEDNLCFTINNHNVASALTMTATAMTYGR